MNFSKILPDPCNQKNGFGVRIGNGFSTFADNSKGEKSFRVRGKASAAGGAFFVFELGE